MSIFDECNCNDLYDEDHCRFALWSPCEREFVENRAFSCFAIHTQVLDDIANEMVRQARNGINVNDVDIQRKISYNCGMEYDDLTDEEIEYLETKINNKLR